MSKVKKFFATFAGVITLLLIKAGNVSAQALYGVPEPQDLYGVPNPGGIITTPATPFPPPNGTPNAFSKVIVIIGAIILIPVIIVCGVIALIKVTSKKEPQNTVTETKIENNEENKTNE